MQFNNLRTEILTEINDTSSVTSTRVEKWLNDAVREICSIQRWNFLVVPESDKMTIADTDIPYDTSKITFDTGIAHSAHGSGYVNGDIISVVDVTDTRTMLQYITKSRLESDFEVDLSTSGIPQYWYYAKNYRADSVKPQRFIAFFPAIAAGETRKFVFSFERQHPESISASLDILIPPRWKHVLINHVLWKAWRYKLDDRWQDAKETYLRGIADMKAAEPVMSHHNHDRDVEWSRMPRVVTP